MRKHALGPRTKDSPRLPSPDTASEPAKRRSAGKFPVFKVPKGAPLLTLEMVKAAENGD
jgi:hypothetical protein